MILARRKIVIALAGILAVWACPGCFYGETAAAQRGATSAKLTTVVLVRHAERGPDEGIGSPITDQGRERSEELARVLKDSGVTKILVSEFIRTQQTVEPLAKALKLEPETVLQEKGIDELAARIRKYAGQTILVCSHVGRIEPLIEKLGGGRPAPIPSRQYDDLFILTIPEPGPARSAADGASGQAKLVVLKYGARSN